MGSDWSRRITGPEYWLLIGRKWSGYLDTSLWLVGSEHTTWILDSDWSKVTGLWLAGVTSSLRSVPRVALWQLWQLWRISGDSTPFVKHSCLDWLRSSVNSPLPRSTPSTFAMFSFIGAQTGECCWCQAQKHLDKFFSFEVLIYVSDLSSSLNRHFNK